MQCHASSTLVAAGDYLCRAKQESGCPALTGENIPPFSVTHLRLRGKVSWTSV
jgi:hypothetical protein